MVNFLCGTITIVLFLDSCNRDFKILPSLKLSKLLVGSAWRILLRWYMQILYVVKDMTFSDIKVVKEETDINVVALLV